MPIHVRRVRVLQNLAVMAALSLLLLWLGRDGLPRHPDALLWGAAGGLVYGWFWWRRLLARIQRRRSRYARNRVFVRFISPLEMILLAAASSHYLLIGLLLLVLLLMVLGLVSGHWWTLLLGSFGLSGTALLSWRLVGYERAHGPVYYQYASGGWAGGEGMLYQTGKVVEPLTPEGRVQVAGELWRAESVTSESIARDERVEVLDREGLVLKVDRVISKN